MSISRSPWAYLAIGLVQGGLLFLLSSRLVESAGGRTLLHAASAAALVGGLQMQLLWGRLRQSRSWLPVLGCALLFAALAGWFAWQFNRRWELDAPYGFGFASALALLLYTLCPFVQAWTTRRGWRFDYHALYSHAWNNALMLLLAGLLVGAFWLLIWLWSALFGMLGIDLFERLFLNRTFVSLSIPMVFALGLRVGLERVQVIDALRSVLLGLCRLLLLPMSSLIILLFLVSLPFTGLQPLWQTRNATAILLSLLLAQVLLANGVFQDGRQESRYPRPLHWPICLGLLGLPVLAGLAGYALWLRVDQYGLTVERFFAILITLVGAWYALLLAVATLRRAQPWLASLALGNPPLALFSAALLALSQTPLLSPLEFSAASQYQRLLDGRGDKSALDQLRLRLGEPGQRRYQALEALMESPQDVPASLRELMSPHSLLAPEATAEWLGEPLPEAQALLDERPLSGKCLRPGCFLMALDLDGDGQDEVLWVDTTGKWPQSSLFAREQDGHWRRLRTQGGLGRLPPGELLERLREGRFSLEPLRYPVLRIGEASLYPME
ncbi:DUF4153 domain-containing protein [Stutzerimonas kirkiae]|uniref:DUF4153 domain-containing protein n=1 Tax=Stutzerimonas kirkiae TaxID=2211392 RepID=UPI00103839BA|nr:DUF4153 domain-containing protein [Stutzerimonas kirkiae]TBV07194.1 DUF4153 domain-containing protein [Stutzerimonas kirkiae]